MPDKLWVTEGAGPLSTPSFLKFLRCSQGPRVTLTSLLFHCGGLWVRWLVQGPQWTQLHNAPRHGKTVTQGLP